MRGEPIDQSLLRQLRLISIEMEPYLVPLETMGQMDDEIDRMGI